jgi:hypothetical protein
MDTVQTEKKPKAKTKSTTAPLRVRHETRRKILSEIAKANKKDFGRRVKPDDLIALALSLLEPRHLKDLQEATLSNSDRLEREYRAYIAKNGPISKDAYLGKRLQGEAFSSIPNETVQK